MRLVLFILLASASYASAHEWYAPSCCSGQDCARIEVSSVEIAPEGFVVQLDPAEHIQVSRRFEETVPYSSYKLRKSLDDDFHACVSRARQELICLYVPEFAG